MSKKIILTIGIAVLIILGIVFYISKINEVNFNPSSSPAVTETSKPPIAPILDNNVFDWQEYNSNLTTTYLFKNLKAPFLFKYPKEWNLDEGLSGIQIYSSDDHIGYEIGTVPKGKFMIQISPDIEDKNNEEIKSWCKNNLYEYDKPIKDILSEKYIEVDGNESYLADYRQENFDSLRQVCIAKSDFKVIIYAEPLDSNYLAIFDKILSTFKFIKPDETANWKTYRNETIGIEFKYPNNWPTMESNNIGDNNIGDEVRNGKSYTSFSLNLPDLSLLNHTFLNMDNMSVDEQYEKIKCKQDSAYIECKEKISDNGVKYVWIIEETKGGAYYEALVATGKYILIFNFQEKDNYEKRASEYQELLSTLKIAPTPAFNSDISGWKTYRNKEYGFRIDYPENWEIKKYKDQRIELTDLQTLKLTEDGKNQSDGGEYYSSRVDIIIFYYSSIEEEYVNKANKLGATTIDELIEKDITMEKIGEIKIDNKNATEAIEHGEGKYYNIFVENNGHLYKVFFPYRQSEEELSETEKQILSTFQLVK